ncbi:phosphoribosyl-ATP pyrophosphatase [Candidatus Carsonella ruddii]|uniref:phosphoribosyl-ATP pyrophosphatase n=1 Tax=Carsonella ruddii TaxID=114186 RepID=UPI00035BFA80|nr:phosphoribosyl-ATP pyrophosphatase [Candidatus Carsonella ruddii]AGS06516.1 phosphoribosyl-ATP pyrophosphatase [Candidatus Carsonella ruddii DC]
MIKKIINLIKKKNIVSNSYSIYTLYKGSDFLIKKLFEELSELLICFNKYNISKNCFNRYFLIKEICDIFYHLFLFIIYNNFSFLEIEKEFLRRSSISGKKEKNFR